MDARDPSLDRRRAVLQLRRPVPALLAGRICGARRGRYVAGAHPRCADGDDEDKLPEVGKYNAGQKLVFWSMSLLIVMLIVQRPA